MSTTQAAAQEDAADYWLSDDGDILPFEPSEDAKASVDWAPFYSGTTVNALRAQLAEREAQLDAAVAESTRLIADWLEQVQKTCAALKQRNDAEEKLAASEARVGVLTEALVPHIADLRRCAAILRTSELAEKFIGTADEFDRAAEELNAAIGSASHD